jgi:ABC-2 type transport system ATP-binding protein
VSAIRFQQASLKLFKRKRRRGGRIGEMKSGIKLKTYWALRDVTFTVKPGEAVAVVGGTAAARNGLLRLAAHTLLPDEGRVSAGGRVLPMIGLKRALISGFTVRQNIHLLGGLLGMSRDEAAAALPWIVQFAGLQGRVDHHLNAVPRPLRPRLAQAIALAVDSPIVLINGRIAPGGQKFQAACYGEFERMRQEGRTFLVASSAGRDLRWLCDRAIYLEDGRIAAEGTVAEMLALSRAAR